MPLGLPVAQAVSSDLLSGYTWSPNIGWTSFNCTTTSNCGAGVGQSNYGVTTDAAAPIRTLSGYAWSSTIGWITFNASDMANSEPNCGTAGFPPCNPTATFNTTNGQVSGWARACSVYASGCSGSLKSENYLGGWRGWIKLRGPNYGVLANGTAWTGYAWGGGPVTGTGNWSPLVGGNAAVGWMSFRGYTTGGTKTIYGIDAVGSGVGPQVIACGVDKPIASVGTNVTWTAVHDPSKLTPSTYQWVSLANNFSNPVTGVTKVHAYSNSGVKTALVKVTTMSGEEYVITCDGAVVPGQPDPGYPSVTVGSFDLRADVPPNPVGAQEGVSMNVTGTFDNMGDEIPSFVSFTSRFEFDQNQDGAADQFSANVSISGAADSQNNIPIAASWTPGVQGTTYRLRLCVDINNDIDESQEGNNCSNWSSTLFTVSAPSNPPPSGSCTVVPRLSIVGGMVTWDSTASGGDGNYTYIWNFNPMPTSYSGGTSNTSADPKVTYNATGIKTATVTITSQSQSTVPISCSSSLRVQGVTEI